MFYWVRLGFVYEKALLTRVLCFTPRLKCWGEYECRQPESSLRHPPFHIRTLGAHIASANTPGFLFSKDNSSVIMKSHTDSSPATARGLQRIMFEKKNNGAMWTKRVAFEWIRLSVLYISGLKCMITLNQICYCSYRLLKCHGIWKAISCNMLSLEMFVTLRKS